MTTDLSPLSGAHVLLGVSGGIAAYKAGFITRELLRAGATVQVVLTRGAEHFIGPATFEGLTGRPVPTDVFDEPADITHVRMAREADVAVFAPATTNLVAKFACGIADDLVTSTFTCLMCPVVIAPAMHLEMWAHPATAANVATLVERGAVMVGPEEGELAGGDVGMGRLAEPEAIVAAAARALASPPARAFQQSRTAPGSLAGKRVVVTAGGTREPLDPVRFLGNRSTGKMGFALAAEAARRGATVDLVAGPANLPTPPGVTRHDVVTALDMRAAVLRLANGSAAIIKAAAVADFRPKAYSDQKIKKDTEAPDSIILERNPDILAELGHMDFDGDRPVLVGFAAETSDEDEHGRAKLERKGADLMVVNRVDAPDAGFAADTNQAILLGADDSRTVIGLTSKTAMAEAVWDRVDELLQQRRSGSG